MWSLLIRHGLTVRISWVSTCPRVELRRETDGALVAVYKPKVSGYAFFGPMTSYGRLLTIGRGA